MTLLKRSVCNTDTQLEQTPWFYCFLPFFLSASSFKAWKNRTDFLKPDGEQPSKEPDVELMCSEFMLEDDFTCQIHDGQFQTKKTKLEQHQISSHLSLLHFVCHNLIVMLPTIHLDLTAAEGLFTTELSSRCRHILFIWVSPSSFRTSLVSLDSDLAVWLLWRCTAFCISGAAGNT